MPNGAKDRAMKRLESHPEYCTGCAHYGGYCGVCSCTSMFTTDWDNLFEGYLKEENLKEGNLKEENLKAGNLKEENLEDPFCNCCKAPHQGRCFSPPYYMEGNFEFPFYKEGGV